MIIIIYLSHIFYNRWIEGIKKLKKYFSNYYVKRTSLKIIANKSCFV